MIIWTVPQKITQGDRITWTQNLDGFDSAFDTLSCFLRGQNSALDLTGTPLLLGGWEFLISEAVGATLQTGKYKAQFVSLLLRTVDKL